MSRLKSQSKVTKIKALATIKKPKKLSPKAAYALAVKLMAEMDCTEFF